MSQKRLSSLNLMQDGNLPPADLREFLAYAEQLLADTEWKTQGNCVGTFNAGFGFDLAGAAIISAMRHFAHDYCTGCPVLDRCREAGIDERYGVWGGLLPDERRRLKAVRDGRLIDD